MFYKKNNASPTEFLFRAITLMIILAGIALRLTEWLHARDLMMDEVNVARNIYERGFLDLLKPLSYQQFAPPLFLWVIKVFSLLFGFGELSLRLFPVLCSCVSLWLLNKLMRANGIKYALWYPLALFAFSTIYLRYGNDVKQYASDSLVALLLLFCMVRYSVLQGNRSKRFIFWCFTGILSIWVSMPSVFILLAVGIYFLITTLMGKRYENIKWIIGLGVVWLGFFGLYYYLLLRQQIGSDYLQAFHEQYFLQIHSLKDLGASHNLQLLYDLAGKTTGNANGLYNGLNLALFVSGIFLLFKKDKALGFAILIPFVCLLAAAAFHIYTLIPRVCIFIMPVFLFVIGYALEYAIVYLKWYYYAPVILLAISVIYKSQRLDLFHKKNRIEIDELTTEVAFARSCHVPYNQIFLPFLYEPNWIYYSSIHPDKKRGKKYKQIRLLKNNGNLSKVREHIKGRAAFVYFWIDDYTLRLQRDSVLNYLKPVDSLTLPSYKVYVYEKR